MPLRYEVGQPLPDVPLLDDRGRERTLAEVADGQPLILSFFRGPW